MRISEMHERRRMNGDEAMWLQGFMALLKRPHTVASLELCLQIHSAFGSTKRCNMILPATSRTKWFPRVRQLDVTDNQIHHDTEAIEEHSRVAQR